MSMTDDVVLDDAVRALVDGPNIAHLATLLRDGAPHVVPVWIGRDDEHLVLLKEEGSVGLRNLERDPRLAISIVDRSDPFSLAHLRGRVTRVERGTPAVVDWLQAITRTYTGAAHPEPLPDVALVRIAPTRATFQRIGGYD
jgi:PPOX class probable F420-dependent enzyme